MFGEVGLAVAESDLAAQEPGVGIGVTPVHQVEQLLGESGLALALQPGSHGNGTPLTLAGSKSVTYQCWQPAADALPVAVGCLDFQQLEQLLVAELAAAGGLAAVAPAQAHGCTSCQKGAFSLASITRSMGPWRCGSHCGQLVMLSGWLRSWHSNRA